MGTINYYYHTDLCDSCKRSNELHVGKLSKDWTFHFRAYRDQVDGSPDIVSLADWERFFKTTPGTLTDESGRVIEDPLKFLANLERPTPAQQQDEDSSERRGSWAPAPDPKTEWRDPDGFAFCDGEFS